MLFINKSNVKKDSMDKKKENFLFFEKKCCAVFVVKIARNSKNIWGFSILLNNFKGLKAIDLLNFDN